MSILKIRKELADLPGADAATMRYEDGGKVEVFTIGDHEIRLEAGLVDVTSAIRKALNIQNPPRN